MANKGRFSINSFGYVVEANQTCADILGMDVEVFKKAKIFKFIKREFKKVFYQSCLRALESTERQSSQVILINKNGTDVPIRLQSTTGFGQDGNRVVDCELLPENELQVDRQVL